MNKIIRFGVSIEEKLLSRFDSLISEKGYVNRSEAIRDLIRDKLITEEISDQKADVMGTLIMIYSHDSSEISDTLNDLQHRYYKNIISTLHVHIDEHNCIEILLLKGKARIVQSISDLLLSTKNVKHGKLILTPTGKHLP